MWTQRQKACCWNSFVVAGLIVAGFQPTRAAEPTPVKIAVFDFELEDRSAGGGMIDPDAIDAESLKKSTEEARRLLAASDRYSVVDTKSAAGELRSAGGIQRCNGCEASLGRKLGADQAMVGVFARVSRTEYTLQVVIRDVQIGAVVSQAFSGLRMGANYAWPRAVTSLINNKVLSTP